MKYLKTDDRSFRSQWFDLFKWLEYCPEKDTCFYYPYRVFGTTESKETTFTKTDFVNKKKALDKQKDFYKHDSTQVHKICMSKWTEQQQRCGKNKEISTLVNESVLEKHRYYISSIFNIIKFLVIQELPLRGSYKKDEKSESGLF